jgi:hypothetical protein
VGRAWFGGTSLSMRLRLNHGLSRGARGFAIVEANDCNSAGLSRLQEVVVQR